MKEMGIRRVSCFNAGLTSEQYHLNLGCSLLKWNWKRAQKTEVAQWQSRFRVGQAQLLHRIIERSCIDSYPEKDESVYDKRRRKSLGCCPEKDEAAIEAQEKRRKSWVDQRSVPSNSLNCSPTSLPPKISRGFVSGRMASLVLSASQKSESQPAGWLLSL